jgi:recombination protein RecT
MANVTNPGNGSKNVTNPGNGSNGNGNPEQQEPLSEAEQQVAHVAKLCGGMVGPVGRALPEGYAMKPEKFCQLCMTVFRTDLATQKNPDQALIWCSDHSLKRVILQAAELGLQPGSSLGHAYFIAYGGSAQFQIGVWGWVELLYRSGKIRRISTDVVYERDTVFIRRGLHEDLVHEIDPKLTRAQRGKPLGAYAVALMEDGTQSFTWEPEEDLQRARETSKAPDSPAYTKWPDEMRQRTVLKRAAKKWPKGVDAARAIDVEENDELRSDLQDMLKDLEARITTATGKPLSKQGAAIDDMLSKRGLGMGGAPNAVVATGSEVAVSK